MLADVCVGAAEDLHVCPGLRLNVDVGVRELVLASYCLVLFSVRLSYVSSLYDFSDA